MSIDPSLENVKKKRQESNPASRRKEGSDQPNEFAGALQPVDRRKPGH
jgi:hypothetical protein